MSAPLVTVVIRSKQEADTIGRVIDLLHAQTIASRLEVIVVDSGSSDGTVDVARARGLEPIEIAAESFTFGGALNTGCAVASAPIIVALSAHAFPPDEAWAERMVEVFEDERIACASGESRLPDGAPLREPVLRDATHAERYPFWGYSNAGGGFRASLWEQRPWRTDMPGTEDQEWSWVWMQQGWLTRIDPQLAVLHDHSHDPLRSTFIRSRREWMGYAMYLDLPPYPLSATLRHWWTHRDGHETRTRACLSPWRASRLAGEWAGRRRGADIAAAGRRSGGLPQT